MNKQVKDLHDFLQGTSFPDEALKWLARQTDPVEEIYNNLPYLWLHDFHTAIGLEIEAKKVATRAFAEYERTCKPAWDKQKKERQWAFAGYKLYGRTYAEYKWMTDKIKIEMESVCKPALEKFQKESRLPWTQVLNALKKEEPTE
jgi:hypothetical protein